MQPLRSFRRLGLRERRGSRVAHVHSSCRPAGSAGGNGLLTAIVPRRRGAASLLFQYAKRTGSRRRRQPARPVSFSILESPPSALAVRTSRVTCGGTFLRPLRQGLSQLAASYLTRHWHARADHRKYGDHAGGRGLVLSRRTTSPGTGMIRGRSAPGSPRTRVAAISPIVFSGSRTVVSGG